MDKFLLAENPMVEGDNHPIYIFHTQKPSMLIQIHHEAIAVGDAKMHVTGNYKNPEGLIETISLSVEGLLICEPKLSEELKLKVEKTLNKAWHWYVAYLKWEDNNIDNGNY